LTGFGEPRIELAAGFLLLISRKRSITRRASTHVGASTAAETQSPSVRYSLF